MDVSFPPPPHLLVPRAVHDLLEHLVEHVLLGLAGAVGRLPHVHLVSEKGEKQALLKKKKRAKIVLIRKTNGHLQLNKKRKS